jgi:uncharacterized membrane protein HdeD (DUF308 family)
MFTSARSLLIVQGTLALIVGVIAISWPGVTLGAIVLLFAVFAIVDAVLRLVRVPSLDGAGAVAGQVLLALVDVAAAVVAIVWPGLTALALTVVVGIWALVIGAGELVMTFAPAEGGWERALYALAGLISLAFGAVLLARPDVGMVSVAELFGFYSILWGISSFILVASGQTEDSIVTVH